MDYVPWTVRIGDAWASLVVAAIPCLVLAKVAGSAWRPALYAAAVACGVVAAVRAFRIRVSANAENILIFNYWRSYRLAWADVTDVGIGVTTMIVFPVPAIVLRLQDGSRRRVQATPGGRKARSELLARLRSIAPASVRFSD